MQRYEFYLRRAVDVQIYIVGRMQYLTAVCRSTGNNVIFVDMKMHFFKYEGAGNDFVVMDNRDGGFVPSRERIAALCDRRFGIGGDGLMLLEKGNAACDFRMRYFNSDGGEASMCGNGGRCISLFAAHAGVAGDRMSFAAEDGMHSAEILARSGMSGEVSLRMVEPSGLREAAGGWFVNTGVPHLVRFVEDVAVVDVETEGRRLRNLPEFVPTGGVNVNFVQVLGKGSLRVRTYERGVEHETLACGTGAVASAVAASRDVAKGAECFSIEVLGGRLGVAFRTVGDRFEEVVLTGPARRVFEGSFDVENF